MVKKIILGILVSIVLVIAIAWITQDRWLPQWNQELAQQSVEYRDRGVAYAQTHDQAACLEEALTQFNTCSGFACTINHGKFLRACLDNAAATEGFCAEVPEFNEKATEDDKTWARHYCWDRDIRGDGCRLLMKQTQFFCSNQ